MTIKPLLLSAVTLALTFSTFWEDGKVRSLDQAKLFKLREIRDPFVLNGLFVPVEPATNDERDP